MASGLEVMPFYFHFNQTVLGQNRDKCRPTPTKMIVIGEHKKVCFPECFKQEVKRCHGAARGAEGGFAPGLSDRWLTLFTVFVSVPTVHPRNSHSRVFGE